MVIGVLMDAENRQRRFGNISTPEDSIESSSKRIKLMPALNEFLQQVEIPNLTEFFRNTGPLGLSLKKTPSFVDLIEKRLSEEKKLSSTTTKEVNRQRNTRAAERRERMKASNFGALYLRIGNWERRSFRDGDLVAKCYYGKRKLVWEILGGGLKCKMEMQFADITAIRATFPSQGPETLEIELKKPPIFFDEVDPQPKKHTIWHASSDFTNGQGKRNRRHYIQFAKGSLLKHYRRLLGCDQRLRHLSQKNFPLNNSPYFDFYFGDDHESSAIQSCHYQQQQQQLQQQAMVSSFQQASLAMNPMAMARPVSSMDLASPMSVMEFPRIEERVGNYGVANQGNFCGQRIHMEMRQPTQFAYAFPQQRPSIPSPQKSLLEHIADQLLDEPDEPLPVACPDENRLMAKVNSMANLLDLQNEQAPAPSLNNHQSFLGYNQEPHLNGSAGSSMTGQSSYESGGWTCVESNSWQPALEAVEFRNPVDGSIQRNTTFSYLVPNDMWE